MSRMPRIAAVTILCVATFSLPVRTQQGPPRDRPTQGDLNRADPCALAPDPPGEANGIEKRCTLGASGGVSRGDFNADGIADLAVGVPDEMRVQLVFDQDKFEFNQFQRTGAG